MRVGLGFDSHQLVEDRPLIIGGVHIPYPKGLAGHSDADCLLHAIADALIGAAGLSSIGEIFPDTDPRYFGANSAFLLEQIVSLVNARSYRVVNLDCTVLAEEPKLVPYTGEMRDLIANILGIPGNQVSIKPKRGEGMGYVGRKEGIAAMAVVLLEEM